VLPVLLELVTEVNVNDPPVTQTETPEKHAPPGIVYGSPSSGNVGELSRTSARAVDIAASATAMHAAGIA